MFKNFFNEFDFIGFHGFIFDLVDSHKMSQISIHPDREELFTKYQLAHIAPFRNINDHNGFIWAWREKKDIVRRISFDQFSEDQKKKIAMKIDLNEKSISLDKEMGISSIEVENILMKNIKNLTPGKTKFLPQAQIPKKNGIHLSGPIITVIVITLLTASSLPWWYSPVTNLLEKSWTNFNTFPGDPSKTINGSVFDIVKNLNQLATDIEKQSSVAENYSGLGIRVSPREYGHIVNTQIQGNISLVKIQGYDDGSLVLICEFSSKWNQKLKLLGSGDVAFWGKIKEYDVSKSSLILEDCSLYQ